MRSLATLFLLTLSTFFCFAQKETEHWFLNQQNRIRLNASGTVTNQSAPNIPLGNESASIADASGNLLFYSNGSQVFDKNLSPMPAFTNLNLTGNLNLKIVPFPDQPARFYLFYINQLTYQAPYTLKYAIIDMSLNSGLGDVVSYNNMVDTLVSSAYTVVNKTATEDFWIVTHRNRSDSFFSRLVTNMGINAVPVISVAGSNGIKTEYNFLDLRTSHDGKMIAGFAYTNYTVLFAYTISFAEVFNFNSTTGFLSSKIKTTRYPGYFIQIGQVEFSPDNRLLYVSQSTTVDGLQPCGFGSSRLDQYNLCYTDSITFTKNSIIIGNTLSFCVLLAWGRMQVGPDKKIYLPYAGTSTLSRLEYPNRIGRSGTMNFPAHTLAGATGITIPKFYHRHIDKAVKNNINYNGGCYPAPANFFITNDTITSINWNFGDPASGAANTSTLLQPQHLFSSPGTYTVTANLFNSLGNLIETVTELVEIKDPGRRLLYGYPTDTAFCSGNSLDIKLQVVNGIFKWSRSVDGYTYSYGTSDSISISGSGTYYVELLQNDCNGCHMIDSIKVDVLPVPFVNLGPDKNLCTGDSIQLQVYETAARHLWSTGDTTAVIWVHTGGTYWVRSEFDNNGCPRSDTIVITQFPPVTFSLPGDTTLCSNQTLLLAPGVANANYVWQNGATTNTFLVTQPGTYWVRITSQNGCFRSDTIHVSYVSAQSVNLGADIMICEGDSVQLLVNIANAGYLWSTGATSPAITIHNSGSYWVRVNNGTCTVADTINITFNPKPVVFLGNDTELCEHQLLTLHATTPGATYLWQDNSAQDTFLVQQPGLYWAQVTVNGCSVNDSINVGYKPLPPLNLGGDTSICVNQTLLLNAAHPAIQSYLWQNNSVQSTCLVTQAGTYHVNITGINGCVNTDTIVILAKQLPAFDLGNDSTLCEQQSLLLAVNLNNATFIWNTGSQLSSITISQAGTYWLEVLQNGCSRRDSILIDYKPLPYVNLGNDTTLCEGAAKLLDASYPGATYVWQNATTNSSFSVTQAGEYHVSVNLNGCIKKDSVTIIYNYKPVVNLGTDLILCPGQQLVLDPGIDDASLLWQNGSTTQIFVVTDPGNYQVTATNQCGAVSDQIVITRGLCRLLLMPTAFTPNGNGLNETFKVKYPEFISSFSMKVFNRWGELIFMSSNPFSGWDGKYKGVDQPSDNYVWIISLTDYNGNKESAKGYILLIR